MGKVSLDRWLTPRFVFPALAVLVVLAVLAAPEADTGDGTARLTTHAAGPYGARGLYEVLDRLGWQVERRERPMRETLDSTAVYALLDPPIQPTTAEVANLLDAVRRGAGLIATPEAGSPLSDSLRVQRSDFNYYRMVTPGDEDDTEDAEPGTDSTSIWPLLNDPSQLNHYLEPATPDSLRDRDSSADTALSLPGDTVFVSVRRREGEQPGIRPAIVGFPLGRGRVVLLGDAGLLRNGRLRNGDPAVLAVRLVEWLAAPGGRVVFSEFHQGQGRHADPVGVVWRALWETPAGRTTLQALIAALLVLLVFGPRAIPPVPRTHIERRSPLEHVGALARAYEQVTATRTATRRLVRGLRRRHPRGTDVAGEEESYLDALLAHHPALRPHVDVVRTALRRPVSAEEFASAGHAIQQIERIAFQ